MPQEPMCSKITGDIQFFLIMHTAHVSVLNILRPTAPCCTISEDQNQWKIRKWWLVRTVYFRFVQRHAFFAYRLVFSTITRNIMTLNFLHTKIFNLSGFQECAKFYTQENFTYTVWLQISVVLNFRDLAWFSWFTGFSWFWSVKCCTRSCCQEDFVTKIFVIIAKFTKITKIFDHGNLGPYGTVFDISI